MYSWSLTLGWSTVLFILVRVHNSFCRATRRRALIVVHEVTQQNDEELAALLLDKFGFLFVPVSLHFSVVVVALILSVLFRSYCLLSAVSRVVYITDVLPCKIKLALLQTLHGMFERAQRDQRHLAGADIKVGERFMRANLNHGAP